jgi:hypothetical protein
MDKIAQANVDRFQGLLKTENDETKRLMIIRLLAEENRKLLAEPETKHARALLVRIQTTVPSSF